MADKTHTEWLREGVESWNRRRKKVDFVPDLSTIRFHDFLPPDFRDSPKTSRYFEKIDLRNADLTDSDLSDQNFSRANFSGADLARSDLRMTNFALADFTRANLSKVDASMSHFQGSMFENTILEGAVFVGAVIEGATFIASTLPPAQLEQTEHQTTAFFDSRTAYIEETKKRRISTTSAHIGDHKDHVYDKIEYSINKDLSKIKTETNKSRKNRYDVFFATNREPTIQRGVPVGFNANNSGKLSYGVCEVIVPEGHRIGSLGSPAWKRLLNRHDDRLKLDHLISLNDELFWRLIQNTAKRMKVREHPTIFIHGFNSTFENAVLRSAQIGYDLGIGQGVGLFSWPSKGKRLSYSADEASSESSKYFLAEFIENFIFNSPKEKVNIIAHSMGCRCLIGALEVLSNGKVSVLKRINQVIMAAADIDTRIMNIQGKIVSKKCKRITSYVSEMDTALKVSGWLHEYPRIGITPPTFVLDGIDTIIVNDKDLGDYSHGYISSNRNILHDIFTLLKHNTDPKDRHAIDEVSDGKLKFWRMRN